MTTSQITATSSLINTLYPVAGVDNDTQGFRDNFEYIQNALTTASNEISDIYLQLDAVTATNTTTIQSITSAVLSSIESVLSTSTTVSYALGAPTTSAGGPGDTQGMIFATSTTLYVCYQSWTQPGDVPIWTKVTTTSW